METDNLTVNIAHLYPEMLNIYGDFGNVCTLEKRLEWRNIKVQTDKIPLGSEIDFNKYDIYFIGGGQDRQQIAVAEEFRKLKGKFKELTDNGTVILGICGGFQLMGNYYETKTGEKIYGLGILDAYTVAGKTRCTGNVTVKTDFLTPDTLVGFENHIGLTYLEGSTKPLGKVVVGIGNNLTSKEEGARYKNVFGTYLHGSVLPKNPAFCDYLLTLMLKKKLNDENYVLPKLNDEIENLAHESILNKAYK